MMGINAWFHKLFPVEGVEYPPGWFGGMPPGPVARRALENLGARSAGERWDAEVLEQERAEREKRKRVADARALEEVVKDPACWSSEGVEFPPPPWSKRSTSRSGTAWDVNTLEDFRHCDETSTHYGRHARDTDNPFSRQKVMQLVALYEPGGPSHEWRLV